MRISLAWLAEYVDLGRVSPDEPPQGGPKTERGFAAGADLLAKRLTAVGLEVEAIERTGGGLEGVVAARIVGAEKHPDAEKLSVTRVEVGKGARLQVVCGARNWQVGDVVPLATVGTTLPGGQRIEKAKLRGVESFGMLCSAKELGLAEDASGLLLLDRKVAPGTPIAKALALEDVLFEVNVTPNRPDCLSHIGIAREVAAILGKKATLQAPRLPEKGPSSGAKAREGSSAKDAVKVRIEDRERCARYAARVVEGVEIGPSPLWLARRLEACGVRSISNVVDATNFVLLELGHPLHAFDLDKVAGHEIVVRTARPGEKLVTLDGKERALSTEDLLIADRDRGSALAGVMGGGDSEISAGTTRVLLESAWFQPEGIRRTSRRHGLKTEASYRFERGADPGMVIPAVDRCAALIAELAGGTVLRGVVDAHPRKVRAPKVKLRWHRPAEILGMDVAKGDARRILAGLGFAETKATKDAAVYQVPSWRVDVSIEEDLVEEIVRTKGYDAIPETLPGNAVDTPVEPPEAQAIERARVALEAAGFSEAVNFSFVAEKELEPFEYHVITGDGSGRALGIALKNPISAELSVMRTSLVPSLLKNVAYNRRQRVEDVRLYENRERLPPTPGPEGPPHRGGGRDRGRPRRAAQPAGLGDRLRRARLLRRQGGGRGGAGLPRHRGGLAGRCERVVAPAALGRRDSVRRRRDARGRRRASPPRRSGVRAAARRARVPALPRRHRAPDAPRPAASRHPAPPGGPPRPRRRRGRRGHGRVGRGGGARGAARRGGDDLRRLPRRAAPGGQEEPRVRDLLPRVRPHAHRRRGGRRPRADRGAARREARGGAARVTGVPGERSPLPIAALGFAAAAALSAWNPISAPFGLAVGLAALWLGIRALRSGYVRWASVTATALAAAAAIGSALVLALTAGVGRELGGEQVVAVPPGVAKQDLDAAAERTRASRERARQELEALEPAGGAKPGSPAGGKGDRKDAPAKGR